MAKVERLKIEYRDTASLVPYARNARTHSEAQVSQIAGSIAEFGFTNQILIDESGVIIAGHGRLSAAQKLQIERVPCITLAGLTDTQRRALILADNRLAENAGWDTEMLRVELEELTEAGADLDAIGFDDDFLEDIIGAPEAETSGDTEPEEPPEKPVSMRGDVWTLGEHRLMCGDSTCAEDVAKLMGGEMADMVFTDPPYGVAIGDKNVALNSVQHSGRCTQNISGDTLSEDELYKMLKSAFINVKANCKDSACYFVTSPQGGSLGLMMMMMMKDAGLEVRHVLMWRKNCATFSIGRLDYDYQHEPIFYT